MKTKLVYCLLSLILIFGFSCENSGDNEFYEPESNMDYMMSPGDQSVLKDMDYSTPPETDQIEETDDITETEDTEESIDIGKKIIRTADISFGVSDYKSSRANIDSIVHKHKAFVSSENEFNSSQSINNTIVIRVPAENFFKLMDDLEGEAEEFESKSISTSDVTEEYVDILKRLENKKKVEAQYIELLKKARTIAEILEVNEHIRVIREEIEAKEGRLRYLKSQVGLSTITLNIHKDYDTVSYGFFHKIGKAAKGGWESLLGLIIELLSVWPILIILTVIFIFVRKFVIKYFKKEDKKE